MRTKLFALVIFFLWVVSLSQMLSESEVLAQYVDTAWVRRYNGPGNGADDAHAMFMDDHSDIYVTGGSQGSGTSYDYATIKYHPNGDTVWVRRYNGPANSYDEAFDIAVDNSGYVYVTGRSFGSGSSYDYATIKYLSNGDTAWVRRYNGTGNYDDWAHAIAVDNSGNVYVTGESYGDTSDYDYVTIKYYPNGNVAWAKRYNGPQDSTDHAVAIAWDQEGCVYVTGETWGSGGIIYEYATIKYYSNGDTAWVRIYSKPLEQFNSASGIAVDGSGNVYVTGTSGTVKYSPDGDLLWVSSWGGQIVALDGFGYVYVTGGVWDGQNWDYATIKYYSNGDTAWVRTYNGPGTGLDESHALALDGFRNVYVTGMSYGADTDYDYATIKYDPNGNEHWLTRYNGPGNGIDIAMGIGVDGSGNVYVSGYSVGTGTSYDYATIKYFQYDSIPFAPAVNYGAGDRPASVFSADLDGDGDLDLATANIYSDNISILMNYGNGTFQDAVNYGTGDYPISIFCADLDGDGDLDLATANMLSNNVSILKNNGNGTFQGAINYGAGDYPISVFCADLDGDGDLDLAVANFNSDNVSILKNHGNGTFQNAVNYGVGVEPTAVFCADLDGDGDLDLAAANRISNNVSILKNNGNGTFQSAVNYPAGNHPQSLFCADLDGDNDLDLAVPNWLSNDVSILKNNGSGSFQGPVNYGAGNWPYSVFCADLDGDTDLDLAVANISSHNVSILRNNGDGTFQSAVNYGAVEGPSSVFCADLDGEGDLDLAVTLSSDSVSILKNLTQVPANQSPWAFSLISPPDQDTIFGTETFQWQIPYDPNFGDQMRYDLYISTSPGFEPEYTIINSNLAVSKFTPAMDSGTYYWKVKAKDNWGAERWSTQTWSFKSKYLTDTLTIIAFSPVDLIVTDPIGDSIGLGFNTIPDADYDTTQDYNHDGDKDDIVTIPNRLVGDYTIEVIAEPGGGGFYDLGIRIDGSNLVTLSSNHPCPPPGEVDTFVYHAPLCWYLRGDCNGDSVINSADIVYLINYQFVGGPPPQPMAAGDVNRDGIVNSADIVYLINYQFVGGPPPGC